MSSRNILAEAEKMHRNKLLRINLKIFAACRNNPLPVPFSFQLPPLEAEL